jgi:hypothetical protein
MIDKYKILLYVATALSVATYSFWQQLPKGSFYIGNSIFIFLLCFFIFIKDRKSFITFVLLALSINNLFDELFFNPKNIGINEYLVLLILPLIWFVKYKKCQKNP